MTNTPFKIIVSYGGGTDSVAMLVNMQLLGIIPDEIIFADTGSEQPHTYEHIEIMKKWLLSVGFPTITTVRYSTKDGELLTLEQDIINNKTIPSIAFGWKTCSHKFKITPFNKFVKSKYPNEKIQVWVGFEYGEERRIKPNTEDNFENYYPLIEWKLNREECIKLILNSGLHQPKKSSCFFCPNMRENEILQLSDELKERVIFIESNATKLIELKGLGRNKRWTDLINADKNQLKIDWDAEDWHEQDCNCIT